MFRRAVLRAGVLAVVLVSVLAACQQAPMDRGARQTAEEVRAADAAWNQAFMRGDLDAVVAAVEPTASVLAPNRPIATGPQAVRALFADLAAMPDLEVRWLPNRVELARSGELAYSLGTYELTYTDPAGQPAADHGKYVSVWRRQADGTWKVVVDIFNSDLPAGG